MHEMTVVSNASCTTNFLTHMGKVDNEEFCIPKGLVTIVYAITTTWKIMHVPTRKDKHVGHDVGQYIIPISTGAAMEVGKVLPEL